MRRTVPARLGLGAMAALTVLFVIAPLYWMIATSFKTVGNVSAGTPQWFPDPISFENYINAFADNPFGRYILNSVIVSVCSTTLVLGFGVCAATRSAAPNARQERHHDRSADDLRFPRDRGDRPPLH